jgi:hypothetical protein
MEAFGALAIASSLVTFSTSSLLLVQNFVKSAETLQKIQREIAVLQYILEECVEIVTSQSPLTTLPQSLERSLILCHEDHLRLLQTLERIFSKKKRLVRMLQITIRDDELMASYHSFRDSVLLLRDLSSEYGILLKLLHDVRPITN